jgi:hypothetical protein
MRTFEVGRRYRSGDGGEYEAGPNKPRGPTESGDPSGLLTVDVDDRLTPVNLRADRE